MGKNKKTSAKKPKSLAKKSPKKPASKLAKPQKKQVAKSAQKKASSKKNLKASAKKVIKKAVKVAKALAPKKEAIKKEIKGKVAKTKPEKKQAKSVASSASPKENPPQKRVPLGPIEPGRLGQKRNCLECGTKFYDFERLPITCPKCFSEFDPQDFEPKISLKSDSKKSRAVEKEEESETELVVSDSGEDFESLEDLSDDDSAVVGIETGKDSDESFD